jgi:hydroxyethylthiazole kinase
MAQVTGIGCAESALIAAMAAVEGDAFLAAVTGLLVMGVAGEIAARGAHGPGSFAPALLDAIAGMDEAALARMARLT